MKNLSHMFHRFTAEAQVRLTMRIDLQSYKSSWRFATEVFLSFFFFFCIFFDFHFLLQEFVTPTERMKKN